VAFLNTSGLCTTTACIALAKQEDFVNDEMFRICHPFSLSRNIQKVVGWIFTKFEVQGTVY